MLRIFLKGTLTNLIKEGTCFVRKMVNSYLNSYLPRREIDIQEKNSRNTKHITNENHYVHKQIMR